MKTLLGTLLGMVLVLGISLGLVNANDEKKVSADIQKLGGEVGKSGWEDLVKSSGTTFKEAELLDVMNLFKLRTRGGLGFFEKPGASADGIEAKLINLARRTTDADLKTDKDIIRAAQATAAIAAAGHNLPNEAAKKNAASLKEWQQWSKDMHDASLELIKAAEAKNVAKIKAAATKVNGTCAVCHNKYRDS